MLFSIGTSNRTADEFFNELLRREVWLVVDVRSSPSSRVPWANRKALEASAARHGIEYAWRGSILGGRNVIETTHPDFQAEAATILDDLNRGSVAIFCAEGDPAHCHRSWKVAAHLFVKHCEPTVNILRDGSEEELTSTMVRTKPANVPPSLRGHLSVLTGGTPSLFGTITV